MTGLGSTGDAVRAVQQFPLFPYADLVVDGSFGPATEEQVRAFQHLFGLTSDGVAGRETWSFKSAEGIAWPLVKPGATTTTNYRVPIVQLLLCAHGAAIVADGSYGPATGEAVRQFQLTQRAQYISTTVGQLDWPPLFVTVRFGSAGAAVSGLQVALNAHGASLAEDGSFGPATEAALREFQRMWTDSADGVAGPLTWRALVLPKSD